MSCFAQFDNIIIFAPTMEKHVDALIDFSENGGNLLIAVDQDVSSALRGLIATLGAELDKEAHVVIDHLYVLFIICCSYVLTVPSDVARTSRRWTLSCCTRRYYVAT
jgi:hypothetical protein